IRKILAAFSIVLLLASALPPDAEAAPQKKRRSRKSTRSAAPAFPVAQGRTLEERLRSLGNSSIATSADSSLQVVELESGRVVMDRNASTPVAPASNMKLFTTGAALDLLSDDFEFVTTVSLRGEVDAIGNLNGDVKITGRGDPTIGGRFHDGRATAVLEEWANALKRAGVKAIAGDVILEHGYFDAEHVHPTWPTDQLTNWYEAPIASLSMQEGCVMIRVLPSRSGKLAVVQMEPPNRFLHLENSCRTGGGRGVFVTRKPGTNTIVVSGSIPPRSGAVEVFVSVMHPVHYFGNVVHETFLRSGIRLFGGVNLVGEDPRSDWRMIAEHRTPLAIVNFVINKKSQNHYAEQLLKTIGADVAKEGSWQKGSEAITNWVTTKVGVSRSEFAQVDGSGMSRYNRASAHAFVQLLRYMWNSSHRREFVSSMPFSGEDDSRLRRRLNTPPYARQVYAKTGYISGVIGLSGYVHAQSGKIYAFSFLFNRYRTGVGTVYRLQDEMLKEIIKNG
ncbi:MAG TPA: D-alanyl-D-alanine carboxypeptidase/D-alanyl-D-alanine-endopeptidase, partial [Thermoanaerobaculia bacterium]